MKKSHKTAAVLVCAGSGSRMGAQYPDKLQLPLSGKPVAGHTIAAYANAETISFIVVVARPEQEALYRQLLADYAPGTPSAVVGGGPERMGSVLNGVRAVPEKYRFVAIGDGARPLTRPADIDRTVRAAWNSGAAVLGAYVTDTVKRVRSGRIDRTLPREQLFAAQTPQVFEREEYLICAAAAASLGDAFTDDSAIFERFGKEVTPVEGPRDNLKITLPEDIPVLQAIMEARKCE